MWDLLVSIPDHCLSFYLRCIFISKQSITYIAAIVTNVSKCYDAALIQFC